MRPMSHATLCFFTLAASLCVGGCASLNTEQIDQSLQSSVERYNHLLKWKKFDALLAYFPSKDKGDKIRQFLEIEKDLYVESIEIRSVERHQNKEGTHSADVWLVTQSYILPSTVLKRQVIQQTWHYIEGKWLLKEEKPPFIALDPAPNPETKKLQQEVLP